MTQVCPGNSDSSAYDNVKLLNENIIQPLYGANNSNSKQTTTNDIANLWNCPVSNTNKWIDTTGQIKPMTSLCGTIAWDGITNPADSTLSNKNLLIKSIVPVKTGFLKDCTTTSNEGDFRQSFCTLQCAYDPKTFTTLAQVQEWEQKYGKYKQNVDNTIKSVNTDDIIVDSTDYSVADDAQFTDNYNLIMQNFCAQPVSDNSKCFIDPGTSMTAKECPNLFSYTPEGQSCRFWLNSFGPKKFEQMSSIGDIYCAPYSSITDINLVPSSCQCYLRNNFEDFQILSSQMPSGVKAGCYYLPCSDPTNYLIGTDIMGTYSLDSNADNSTFGLTCGDQICENVLTVQSNDDTEIKNNKAYIQCGSSSSSASVSSKNFFGKLNFYLKHPKGSPKYFTLALLFYISIGLLGLLIIYYLVLYSLSLFN